MQVNIIHSPKTFPKVTEDTILETSVDKGQLVALDEQISETVSKCSQAL